MAFVLEQTFLALLGDRQKKVAMPHGLGEDEQQVEPQRGDRGKDQLAG